jgi:dipeptidyl aminopeptidase/acylaminoacyl peptidase
LKKFALAVAALALISDSHPIQAQTKHTPSLTESLSLKGLAGQEISPDGKFIAYRVRETDWKENAYVRQIWLVDTATGESFQLTRGKKSAGAMEWSPDGRWLAFVTEREGQEERRRFKRKARGPADLAHTPKRWRGLAANSPSGRHRRLPLVQGFEANRLPGFRRRKQSREGSQGKILRLRSL